MDLNIINLKETFPSIEQKELNAFIKYQIKFSLTLDNLKCINPDCNNNKKWGSTKSGPAYTCYSIVCKTKMKEQVNKDKAQLAKKTYLAKTGYENPGQNPDIKLKKINSSLQKYGTSSPNSNPEIKARQKEAIFKKYGCHISQHESVKQKARKNSLQKYGTTSPNSNSEIKARQKEAIFKKYGCGIAQHESVKQKKIETCLFKFGVSNPFKHDKIKEKINNTNMTKYGNIHPISSLEIKQKIIKNNFIKFGTCYKTQHHITNYKGWDNKQFWVDNFLTKDNNFDYIKCMEYFNVGQVSTHRQIKKLNIDYKPIVRASLKEQALIPALNNLNIYNIVTNSRTIIGPLELDIYLPDLDLAIEYNGAYWHQDSKKPVDYHQSKSIACLSKGIRLLHIFEGYNDYNLEETLKDFLNYKDDGLLKQANSEPTVFDLTSGCYPLLENYKIQEPELINIMGFNIYNAGKIWY